MSEKDKAPPITDESIAAALVAIGVRPPAIADLVVKAISAGRIPGIIATAALIAVTGCASIVGEKMQPVSVTTVQGNKEVSGVGCTLMNDAGKWFVNAPGSVTVHKSTGDLAVDCGKDGNIAGHETLVSKSNGAVWGNIIAGGGVGYIVDRNTGAGFNYPGSVTVELRQIGEPVAQEVKQ